MYIAPNSTIKLMRRVPLDPDYENTILFNSVSDQTAYFSSSERVFATLGTQYYQRAERGYCRVKLPIAKCLDCNYMAFKNTSFTEAYQDKWFYAFVTSVEYINNEVTQIEYSIDVMQTYMFDVEILPSYVEREHIPVAEDTIGANITPEPMQLSEYVTNGEEHNLVSGLTGLGDYCVIAVISDSLNLFSNIQHIHCGVYSGLTLLSYRCDDLTSLQALINTFTVAPGDIVSMYLVPVGMLPTAPTVGGTIQDHIMPDTSNIATRVCTDNAITPNSAIDGYVPRNNKLYTYPYNFYSAHTSEGNSMTLRYEFFDNLQPKFDFIYSYLQPIEGRLYPKAYKNGGRLHTESLSITNFPQIAWVTNAFMNWISREWFPMLIDAAMIAVADVPPIAGGMNSIQQIRPDGKFGKTTAKLNTLTGDIVPVERMGGYNVGNKYNLAQDSAHFISSTLQDTYTASIQANITRGSITGGSATLANLDKGVFGDRYSITAECARRVDDFLTRYGYATHQMKVPYRTGRTYFNYVKTSQVNIHVLPLRICQSDDVEAIKGIYNKGITFWHDPSKCGMFTQEVMDNN